LGAEQTTQHSCAGWQNRTEVKGLSAMPRHGQFAPPTQSLCHPSPQPLTHTHQPMPPSTREPAADGSVVIESGVQTPGRAPPHSANPDISSVRSPLMALLALCVCMLFSPTHGSPHPAVDTKPTCNFHIPI